MMAYVHLIWNLCRFDWI